MMYQAPLPVLLYVWDLDAGPCALVISAAEAARAGRVAVPRGGARFAAARAGMRRILGDFLACDPAGLVFASGPHGKPFLPAHPDVQFNLSHSHHLAALALTRGLALGVDIERVRPVGDGLAARFFAPEEAAALAALPPALREAAFHACWTRKEAMIKAIGTGLATRLDRFAVSIDPAAPRLLWLEGGRAEDWQMHGFIPAPGFAGAIAAPARGWEVVRRDPPWRHQHAARPSR